MDNITLIKPDDFHLHLRQGNDLLNYASESAKWFKKVLVMPNTLPPIDNAMKLEEYRKEITSHSQLIPLMTFKVSKNLNEANIVDLKQAGAVAGKIYPANVTTHSEDGVKSLKEVYSVLKIMEKKQLILCIHCEDPKVFSLDREWKFLEQVDEVVRVFPRLKIVLEHLSDHRTVEWVKKFF